MRVLHSFKVYTAEREGGIQRAITALAAGMRDSDYQHDYFTLADDGPWRHDRPDANLTVHAARRAGAICATDISLTARRQFRALAREADVIHYHLPWPMVHVLDGQVPSGTPRVATYHSDICRNPFLTRLYEPLMERFLRSLDAVIATTDVYTRTSPVLQRLSVEQVDVVELGVEVAAPSDGAIDAASDALASVVGEGFMLFLGATRRYKGAPVAIDALRHTATRLVIAGECRDQSALEEQAERAGVRDRVAFLGRVTEAGKWALLWRCRALVMPATLRSEAFGLALVEAGAAGRPAITCEIGTGTSVVVQDGQTGLVVPPNESALLGEAMQRLHTDPALATALGEAGYRRYCEHFTAAAYGGRMQRIYDRLIGRGGSASVKFSGYGVLNTGAVGHHQEAKP